MWTHEPIWVVRCFWETSAYSCLMFAQGLSSVKFKTSKGPKKTQRCEGYCVEQVQSLLPRAGERKERQRGRRGATQLIGVSGLHIDASHLPFLSLFLLHFLLCFSLPLGKGSLAEVERLLLLLMHNPHPLFSCWRGTRSVRGVWGMLEDSQWACRMPLHPVASLRNSCCVPASHLPLIYLLCPLHLLFDRMSLCKREGSRHKSIPVLSPHTTVSLPFPGLIQPSPGALLPPRLALLSLRRRAEQRCQVWRVFADQIHMPDVMPTSRDMKIRSISDATYESRGLALNSPQWESW